MQDDQYRQLTWRFDDLERQSRVVENASADRDETLSELSEEVAELGSIMQERASILRQLIAALNRMVPLLRQGGGEDKDDWWKHGGSPE